MVNFEQVTYLDILQILKCDFKPYLSICPDLQTKLGETINRIAPGAGHFGT